MSKYISFHNHDTKSLLDSCLKTVDLVKWAKANNMNSVGITNHGTMSSHLELYKQCKKYGIKPLLGIEFYVTENNVDKDNKKIRDNYHLIAIPKTKEGWHNIIKLHNLSYRKDRYYYDPRITLEDLFQYKKDLIITSACIGGVIGRPWLDGNLDKAVNTIKLLKENFNDDFYLELQNHEDEDLIERKKQHDYNKFLIKIGKEFNIKCIIQNDSHYYLKEDWLAHQVLLCKNTNSKLSKPTFKFGSKEYFLKNEVEMIEVFNQYPLSFIEECINNTTEIAEKVKEFDITNKNYDCPSFGKPDEVFEKLKNLTFEGLNKKFSKSFLDENPEYIERINEELEAVKNVGYVDYFLMLVDLFSFMKKNNVYVGIARGSAGGSLVLYCLGVIGVDPIKYNLLFSRFINVDRVSMCDADIDVSMKDRPKVIQYLKNKYGENHVCNIGTYSELTAKSAFKAVASVLEVPFDVANRLTSLMDSNLSLQENYNDIETFRSACQTDELIKKTFEIALVLEGTYAQTGIHACGMLISSKPLDEVCACITVKDTKGKDRITTTAFEMKELDGDLKLLKLDILSLKTLDVIEGADTIIKKNQNSFPDYLNLDVNDEKTYKMLSDGYSSMVFQFESPLMQRILKQVRPKNIEDLSCVTALARPGALDSGLTEQYIARRNNLEEITTLVKGTEQFMEDTLQLPIYQENIMQISRVMAGFSGSEADTLRKYVGKKDPEKLKAERKHFTDGAVKLGHTLERANEIFDIFEKFGNYGFNKSHALGYSLLSYATAYYKCNYPREFITSMLNSVLDELDKINMYISEALRLGIPVLPPDINESDKTFTLNNKGEIRFGLNAIKGLGASAVTDILKARSVKPFESLKDFIERTSKVDRSNIQSLLRVGAFDNIQKNIKRYDKILDYFADVKNSKVYEENGNIEESTYIVVGTKACKKSGKYLELVDKKRALNGSRASQLLKQEYTLKQEELINAYIKEAKRQFLQFKEYSPSEKINNEKELMGFNISINPYKRWSDFKKFYIPKQQEGIKFIEFNDLVQNGSEYIYLDKFNTVALLSDIKEIKTKKGRRMAKLTFEYYGVKCTATVFQNLWENNLEFKLKSGNMVSIIGRLEEANKQYNSDDYEISLYNIRQLNVLVNENNKCIIEVKDNDIDKINEKVSWLTNTELKNNLPIEKCVIYKIGDKYKVLCGLNWVNDTKKLTEIIY